MVFVFTLVLFGCSPARLARCNVAVIEAAITPRLLLHIHFQCKYKPKLVALKVKINRGKMLHCHICQHISSIIQNIIAIRSHAKYYVLHNSNKHDIIKHTNNILFTFHSKANVNEDGMNKKIKMSFPDGTQLLLLAIIVAKKNIKCRDLHASPYTECDTHSKAKVLNGKDATRQMRSHFCYLTTRQTNPTATLEITRNECSSLAERKRVNTFTGDIPCEMALQSVSSLISKTADFLVVVRNQLRWKRRIADTMKKEG